MKRALTVLAIGLLAAATAAFPQMQDGGSTSESVGIRAGFHRGLSEPAGYERIVITSQPRLHRLLRLLTFRGSPKLVKLVRIVPANDVHVIARHADGTVFHDEWVHNLRVDAGVNWQYNQMAGTAAAVCTYIALSNDGGTPAVGDTTLASEITINNLGRANATPAHTSNATSYTLTYTWTASGTSSAQKAGMFNNSSAGTLCFENTFTQVNMNSGDTLQAVWTVNF